MYMCVSVCTPSLSPLHTLLSPPQKYTSHLFFTHFNALKEVVIDDNFIFYISLILYKTKKLKKYYSEVPILGIVKWVQN